SPCFTPSARNALDQRSQRSRNSAYVRRRSPSMTASRSGYSLRVRRANSSGVNGSSMLEMFRQLLLVEYCRSRNFPGVGVGITKGDLSAIETLDGYVSIVCAPGNTKGNSLSKPRVTRIHIQQTPKAMTFQ